MPRVNFATGGLLKNSPIVCGGYDSRDCVVIGKPEMEIRMKMIEKKYGAASVVLDQNTLWIVGGKDEQLKFSQYCVVIGEPEMKMIKKERMLLVLY